MPAAVSAVDATTRPWRLESSRRPGEPLGAGAQLGGVRGAFLDEAPDGRLEEACHLAAGRRPGAMPPAPWPVLRRDQLALLLRRGAKDLDGLREGADLVAPARLRDRDAEIAARQREEGADRRQKRTQSEMRVNSVGRQGEEDAASVPPMASIRRTSLSCVEAACPLVTIEAISSDALPERLLEQLEVAAELRELGDGRGAVASGEVDDVLGDGEILADGLAHAVELAGGIGAEVQRPRLREGRLEARRTSPRARRRPWRRPQDRAPR